MTSTVFFEEIQRPRQIWVWVTLLSINILPLIGLYVQIVQGKPFGNNPMSNEGLIIIFCLLTALTVFVLGLTLSTQVKEDGIYVRMAPFHRKERVYKWDELHNAYVRKYKPLAEFGGWGIRYGFNQGMAFNISGNMGLQLEFKNGKKLLIGTRNPEALAKVLEGRIAQPE